MIANNGYPYVSTYTLTRAAAAPQGIKLTRASQTIQLSRRGDERYENVVMFDMRLAKTFRFGSRSISRRSTSSTSATPTRSSTRRRRSARATCPAGGDPILSPRIIRVGFSLNF